MLTLTALLAFLLPQAAATSQPAPARTASQPASAPTSQATLRRPEQAEILRKLIEEREAPKPILPQVPKVDAAGEAATPADSARPGLLADGTMLVQRPGRFVLADGRAEFVLAPDAEAASPRAIQIERNQLLELMEREAERGAKEFIITAEVTRYRGQNFIILRQVRRQLPNGNLAP